MPLLTQSEVHRLAAVRGAVNEDIKRSEVYACDYKLEMVQWLADKLSEINTELTTVYKNIQEVQAIAEEFKSL